ncbi:MAG TPA: C-type lectin domain-containing protein, partial [Polyangiaceae bacterium]|nr:C-type lectin domain-containing protein [Polyangiaceae bacterium]
MMASLTRLARNLRACTYGAPRVGNLIRGAGVALCILSACGEDASPPPPLGESLDEPRQTPRLDLQVGEACAEGTSESCTITLGEHAGVLSCYEGTRTCREGRFSACENGQEFTLNQSTLSQATPGSGTPDNASNLRRLSYGPPALCQNNPCNRYCHEFNEVPPEGLRATIDSLAPPVASWSTGSLADYPPDAVAVGLQQPCQVAGDCQFNTVCTDPSVGSCSHSVCVTGEPLPDNCNRCTDSVCAQNADCCRQEAECIHDPCDATGAPLDPECDTCVAAVCAFHPECCDVSWNDACVSYIATECAPLGQTCGCPEGGLDANGNCYHLGDQERDWNDAHYTCGLLGTGWNLIQVDGASDNDAVTAVLADGRVNDAWLGGSANLTDEWSWFASGQTFFVNDAGGGSLQNGFSYENWDIDEPQLGVIGRGIATNANGEWRDEPIETLLEFVCKGPPTRLGPRQGLYHWGPECVELAQSTCGVHCPATVPQGLGACLARPPSQFEAGCAAFDLAIGPTCSDGTTAQVPVCNHGQSPAHAGLTLTHLPASELGKAAPDLSDAIDCTLTEEIPAGRCVSITGCPGLTADRALLVNPPGAGQDLDECRLDDNWSVYRPVDCGTPVCEAATYDAARVAAEGCAIPMQNPLGMDPTLARMNVLSSVSEPHCADDEVLWGSSCYHFSSDIQTWNGARTRCEGRGDGWNLVALNSALENSWVRGETDPLKDVQIGFTDNLVEGNHVWSNATCRSWINWDLTTLQPNNAPAGSEQCSRMTAASADRWEDTDCNDSEHPYVCEGPVVDARGGCSSGELAGPDGRCYALDNRLVSAAEAADICSGRGLGWSRVALEDANTYAFVTGLINCTPAWLDQTSPLLLGASVISLGAPYLDEFGLFRDTIDGQLRATLCQGPPDLVTSLPLSQVADSTQCAGDDEYYFEGLGAPENLVLCPDTCGEAARLPGSRLDLEVPCLPPSPPAIETIADGMYYVSDCEGGGAIWDFFYYDAVTPADSRIEFEIRTAPSIADFSSGTIGFTSIA